MARKGAYYMMRVRIEGYPIFAGARELVEAASEAGLMLGVVSGALRAEVEGALTQLSLEDRFKALVTAEDVRRGKPDPEGFRRGLMLLNGTPPLPQRLLHPHEVLAIEDSPHGLEAARQTGLATLGVAHSHDLGQLELADRIVESLEDLDLPRLRELFRRILLSLPRPCQSSVFGVSPRLTPPIFPTWLRFLYDKTWTSP